MRLAEIENDEVKNLKNNELIQNFTKKTKKASNSNELEAFNTYYYSDND